MILVYLLYLYLLIGVVVSIWFAFYKVARIDEGAKATSIGFKLLLLPGSILLWPIVLHKTFSNQKHHGSTT